MLRFVPSFWSSHNVSLNLPLISFSSERVSSAPLFHPHRIEILGLILHNCLIFEEEKVEAVNTSILIPTKSTTETSKPCVLPTDDRLQISSSIAKFFCPCFHVLIKFIFQERKCCLFLLTVNHFSLVWFCIAV